MNSIINDKNTFIKCPRGTKDILPKDKIAWYDIENIAHNTLQSYGYEEIRTPIFEETQLFERSIGEYTEVVNKEMYTFLDQGNRQLTLRPEGTAGVVRSLIENQLYLNQINRLWYYGPMFRYERPQSGRQRQFHQLGIECIGTFDARADFEIISIAWRLLQSLQISNLKLEINSIGDSKDREEYISSLRLFFNQYTNELDEQSLKTLKKNPLRLLDSKSEKIKSIIKNAPLLNNFLGEDSKRHFAELCNFLDIAKIPYKINPKLVRGLDYYTYTAFEIKSKQLGAQDTVCGGGRYNNLIEQLNGPSIPAVGCALGIERLLLLYQQQNQKRDSIDFMIINLDESTKTQSILVMNSMHELGFNTHLSLYPVKINKQIKKATKLQVRACIIIGEDEIKNNTINIRWMKSKKQTRMSINDLNQIKYTYLEELLVR